MNYLFFIWADGMPETDELATIQRELPEYVEKMNSDGARLLGRELDLPETAATVRVRDGETLVTDGPFIETKEFVAGFDVMECADLDEAIGWAADNPISRFQQIEIRPFREGLELSEEAFAFGRGENAGGKPYLMLMCLDGIPGPPDVEASLLPEGLAWAENLKQRGIYVLGHPVQHKDTATTVRVRDGETLLSDGPFVETKEFVGGIAVVNCTSREQAIEIAAAHPLARHHMVEVRPFFTE